MYRQADFRRIDCPAQWDREKSNPPVQSGKRCGTEEMDGQPGRVRGSPHIQTHASGLPGKRSVALHPNQEQDFLQAGGCAEAVGIK